MYSICVIYLFSIYDIANIQQTPYNSKLKKTKSTFRHQEVLFLISQKDYNLSGNGLHSYSMRKRSYIRKYKIKLTPMQLFSWFTSPMRRVY